MTVITVENLGKKYTIGHQKGTRYQTLRDTLAHTSRGVLQRLRHPLSPNREIVDLEEIWALRDVNFEIKQGERVGIIGRNGAGKSTLLKILSRITHPTTGRVTLNGRVASLLEVGTGFHPELSGRENIYLNGAILGMTRQEIKSKFDEIVAFAEVEKFLDTPVKHYSSGMYVRLAFAVAAHLEPEILLVDEVLAVGDAQFQKKCLGKMEDVAKEGRTVLFVSHNMLAVRGLCNSCILLKNGQLECYKNTNLVIESYLTEATLELSNERDTSNWERSEEASGKEFRILRVSLLTPQKKAIILTGEPLIVEMDVIVTQKVEEVVCGFSIYSIDDVRLFMCTNAQNQGYPYPYFLPGRYRIQAIVSVSPLSPGRYRLDVGARCNKKGLDLIKNLMFFDVEEGEMGSPWFKISEGLFRQSSQWSSPKPI